MPYKLIVVSGFLGSGKTTAITALIKLLTSEGKKVGVITNDYNATVDTQFIKSNNIETLQIPGGCFCHSLDKLTETLENLSEASALDVIIAEPIGSSANLVSSVFHPILKKCPNEFIIAPLTAVVDPKRLTKPSRSSEINYVFDLQLSEADVLLLNKTDILNSDDIQYMIFRLKTKYPNAKILPVSSKIGTGITEWLDLLNSESFLITKNSGKLDHIKFSKAEIELSWYSDSAEFYFNSPSDFNMIIKTFFENISQNLLNSDAFHIKIFAESENDFAKASITAAGFDFAQSFVSKSSHVTMMVNARANCSPTFLGSVIKGSMAKVRSLFEKSSAKALEL